MRTIILDTNFLVYCATFKLDFFREFERICHFPYRLAVLDLTINELAKIHPRDLKLIKLYITKIEILTSEQASVDLELIARSERGAIIATHDLALKKKLHLPIVTIRQKQYLILQE